MGITERREREKQQRQQDIIEAAETVFFRKGIENSTMDDVAAQAELSKGTLYLYFKSKEEIYLAITVRGMQIMNDLFQRAIRNGQNGLEKSLKIGEAFHKFAREYPDYFNALSYYELKEHESDSEMIHECACTGQESLDILIEVLQEGIRDGSVKPDLDPKRVAVIMWGMASGVIQLVATKGKHLANDHGFDMDNIIEDSYQMIRCSLENK